MIAPEGIDAGRADELTELARGEGYCVALWRNVYIVDLPGEVTIEALDATVEAKQAASAIADRDLVVLNVLSGSRILPAAEVREHAAKKQNEDTAGVAAHAVVVDGEGFWAGAIRGILAGLYLVSRSPFPRRVFSNEVEALAWFAELQGETREWVAGALDATREIRARTKA